MKGLAFGLKLLEERLKLIVSELLEEIQHVLKEFKLRPAEAQSAR